MKILKYSSNFEIIDSGALIAYDNDSNVIMSIECDENFTFNLKFVFDSSDCKDHNLKLRIDDNTIELTCTNFDNALGTGTAKPIELATVNGKKVYLNFCAYSLLNNAMRKIDYTIYVER